MCPPRQLARSTKRGGVFDTSRSSRRTDALDGGEETTRADAKRRTHQCEHCHSSASALMVPSRSLFFVFFLLSISLSSRVVVFSQAMGCFLSILRRPSSLCPSRVKAPRTTYDDGRCGEPTLEGRRGVARPREVSGGAYVRRPLRVQGARRCRAAVPRRNEKPRTVGGEKSSHL